MYLRTICQKSAQMNICTPSFLLWVLQVWVYILHKIFTQTQLFSATTWFASVLISGLHKDGDFILMWRNQINPHFPDSLMTPGSRDGEREKCKRKRKIEKYFLKISIDNKWQQNWGNEYRGIYIGTPIKRCYHEKFQTYPCFSAALAGWVMC